VRWTGLKNRTKKKKTKKKRHIEKQTGPQKNPGVQNGCELNTQGVGCKRKIPLAPLTSPDRKGGVRGEPKGFKKERQSQGKGRGHTNKKSEKDNADFSSPEKKTDVGNYSSQALKKGDGGGGVFNKKKKKGKGGGRDGNKIGGKEDTNTVIVIPENLQKKV